MREWRSLQCPVLMFAAAMAFAVAVSEASRQQPQAPAAPTRANILRGEYGRYRANNDVTYYHLDVRIDPEKKFVAGKNTIRFKMLKDDTRIQLDLWANLTVDKIEMNGAPLKYERELNAVFVDFTETLKAGRTYDVDFHYSGTPTQTAASAVSPSARTRRAVTGSSPRARARARVCGGPIRISGTTKSSRWI